MIRASVDFSLPGKQFGHLYVPYSYNMAGWANLMVPISVISNGEGPTALVLAGNHGDEYPGQVAVMRLLRELTPEHVTGRIILIPTLTMPGAKASTRLSPLDGKNFNRCFPGNPAGTPSEMLADYLTTVLFPLADIVIDIHTGGRGVDFYPCAHMHLVPKGPQREAMLAGTEAWNSDFCFLYADVAGTGLLPVEAESQGKIVITTEMGGSENVTAAVHQLTQSGLRNVLVQSGVLKGQVATRESLGLPPIRWVQALNWEDYRFAPESGVYENMVTLGTEVVAGQTVGAIHFLERPEREPVNVVAARDGILIATRAPTIVTQGDCVACIAQEIDPRRLP
ncbi:succinylglutamate desuccinylase/aspartoacylase family protein [Zavarzinella formosa]|uniref:succinylglutamate desuccinylase/aspartoacylase family protein n=1 Tax=Zavarzinella formosa TaxID=360055 RepID=UPI00031F844E|nr:succinylglutamate desuccinylase/aspartoacylase family protein [Zavarzinella formosa]